MKEVSCKAFQPFFKRLDKKGIELERMLEGSNVTLAELTSKSGRCDWSDLVIIHKNLRQWFGDDDLDDVGRSFFRARALRFVFVIARLLLSPMGFYKWLNTPRKGAGNQFFTCVVPSFKQVSEHECELDLVLPEGYEVCWDFYLITRGSFAEAPTLFGYKPANVELERLPHGGRFKVKLRKRTPFLTRIRSAILWPFTARAAAKELQAAHEDLTERYEQLAKTTAELETYKNKLEAMVEERTQQLREALAARERFFGNISHEIRTPLSLILLAAGDIDARAGGNLDERAKKSLGSVSDGAKKLVRLVDELLLLAAGQEDKLKIHPEPTDLAALVDHVASAWRPAAEAAGLELVVRAPDKLLANVDPVALERVVSNLMSNANKYTPRGGRIELELVVADGGGVRLSVLDNGPGIDDELAGRLFGRFERAAGESRRKVGTGIGLSLVKELVQAHGGTIAARTRATGGTEMRVDLPASIVLRSDAEIAAATTAATHARMRAGEDLAPVSASSIRSGTKLVPEGVSNGTVLVAEDDPALAEMIAKLLAEEYTVVVGLDGQDALAQISEHQPHLLVTDVDMPRMNGIELAKKFRELTGDRVAPIIILSAVLDLHTRVAGLEAGAVDYVSKPFDPAELRARVRAQFRMRDLAVRLHRAEQVASLGILVSGLAHELRNPANGVVNAIAPLKKLMPKDVMKPEGPIAQLFGVVEECGTQIAQLSRQLLDFRGGGDLELRPIEFQDLIERAIRLVDGQLDGIELRKLGTVKGELLCAAPLLMQVIANLLENAAHAAGSGGWIEIQSRQEGGRITVEVADSGPGVPLALRERVFEPFFTTKPPGQGTGLGLSVSRAIVNRHGGLLEIRERGARPAFVVDLPQKIPMPAREAVSSGQVLR